MLGRDGHGPSNPSYSILATNDGTLNAIVNKSVRSLDVPVQDPTSHEDEMLSWLHYPVDDPSDRGYCSDLFGDLPRSSARVVRHSFSQLEVRPQHAPLNTGASIFSGMLSHQNLGVLSTDMRAACTREAAESCGSRPAEVSCQVAGADAVAGLGACHQAADFTTSHLGMEVLSRWDSDGEVLSKTGDMVEPSCKSVLANGMIFMQSEMSQSLSQGSSQQQASFTGHVPATCPVLKPLDLVNCHSSSAPMGKQTATNFVLFSRRAVETKANLHVVGESSGPTNIERVRQQTGQHGMLQEPAPTYTMPGSAGAAQVRWLPPPTILPPPPHCSFSVELEKSTMVHGQQPPPLPPPLSSVCETRDATNLSKDTVTNSRIFIMSSKKGLGTPDKWATSPSQCSASSTEISGKIADSSIKRRNQGVGDDFDYQSEYAEDIANNKKSLSNVKRMRTAEMHNQSERKRRVKINDKLKTLQELIPNGNKPDKASLLDAVIEYVKLLQSLLQVMSIRTGIGIPSWMIPNVNMQHLQMSALPQIRLSTDMGMGVGLGVGMRMGMGTMEANAAAVGAGCTIMPMPLFPGQLPIVHSSYSAALQPTDQLHASGMANTQSFYVASSQIQHPPMNLNMSQNVPIYNARIPPPMLQSHPQPQQQHQVQLQQLHQPLGNIGKKTLH